MVGPEQGERPAEQLSGGHPLRAHVRAGPRQQSPELGLETLEPAVVGLQRGRERRGVTTQLGHDERVLVLGVRTEEVEQGRHGAGGEDRLPGVGEVGAGDEHGAVEERRAERLVDGLETIRP